MPASVHPRGLRRGGRLPAAAVVALSAAMALIVSTGVSASAAPVPRSLGQSVRLGAWVDGMDADPSRLDRVASMAGRSIGVASVFRGATELFPSAADRALTAGGRRQLLVSWHLDTDRFSGWASGAHDADLDQTARAVKAYGQPVYIRPWAEMNADWVDFQPTPEGSRPQGGTPAEFISAWRHVVDRFSAAGALNARWVFNPTADTYPGTTAVRTIWPGRQYVDVLGMDGYNWGTHGSLRWRSFRDIFGTQYGRLTVLAPTLPVWICETGSTDPASRFQAVTVKAPPGQTKGTWWRDAFATTSMPRISTVVFFAANKERDWRLDSSPGALLGLKSSLSTARLADG